MHFSLFFGVSFDCYRKTKALSWLVRVIFENTASEPLEKTCFLLCWYFHVRAICDITTVMSNFTCCCVLQFWQCFFKISSRFQHNFPQQLHHQWPTSPEAHREGAKHCWEYVNNESHLFSCAKEV